MIVEWHCRSCNEKGEQEISMEKVLERRRGIIDPKNKESFLDIVREMIDHYCRERNIGIKVKQ
jgi:hypothetical protein